MRLEEGLIWPEGTNVGEDIHQKTYLKKKDGGYVNVFEVADPDLEYGIGAQFVKGRNYQLFSLFGSRRGEYPELPYAEYGLPGFLAGGVFDRCCRECGYYGFVWYTAETLCKAVKEYMKTLKRPDLYVRRLKESGDGGLDALFNESAYGKIEETFSPGLKTENDIALMSEIYDEWFQRHASVMQFLRETLDCIRHVVDRADENGVLQHAFDLKQTVYLFYFDS